MSTSLTANQPVVSGKRRVKPWTCDVCQAGCTFEAMNHCQREPAICPVYADNAVTLCNNEGTSFEFGVEFYPAIEDFHRARRMFFMFWSEVFLAPYNDTRDHLTWMRSLIPKMQRFRKQGWTAEQLINTWPRGYFLNNRVVVYIGAQHAAPMTGQQTEQVVKALQPHFPGCELWLGVERGEPGVVWRPQQYWGQL